MVDKFYRKNLDLRQVFELWNIDMLTLCDIQEHSVDEEEECFYVQKLTPRKAKIKEKLSKSFVIYATFILFLELSGFCEDLLLSSCP